MADLRILSKFERYSADRRSEEAEEERIAKQHTIWCWISAGIIILEIVGFIWMA